MLKKIQILLSLLIVIGLFAWSGYQAFKDVSITNNDNGFCVAFSNSVEKQ